MADDDETTINTRGLDQILKALKMKPPVARVGILGSSPREGGKSTNAEIGAAHEFGTTKIPQRSFLRIPIADHLDKEMQNSGYLDKETLKEVIKTASVIPWLKGIAKIAEKIVQGAFDTGGYGKWEKWKNSGYQNNTGMLLVDTQQLRESITSEVK